MKKIICLPALLLMIALIVPGAASCTVDTLQKDDEGKILSVTFPLAEQITVTVTGPAGFENADPNDCAAVKWVEKETNIDFVYYPITDTEKSMVMLTSGQYTDLYMASFLRTDDVLTYGASGVFLDGNRYITPELTPHICALFEARPTAKGVCTAPDGGLYCLPIMEETEGNFQEFWYIVNEEMLDAVGMDAPTSMDEVYECLKAFKEQDANGNGKADEVGEIFGGTNFYTFPSNLSIWGLPTKPGEFENLSYVDGGKVTFAMDTPNFQAAIRYYNKLYAEGLLDKESFTQDDTAVVNKIEAETPVVGATMYSNSTPEGYIVVGPPEGTEGFSPCWYIHPGYYGVKNRVVVTDRNPNPEIIYAYLDAYHFSFENSMKFRYGEIFQMNDDGTYRFETYDSSQYDTQAQWIWEKGGYNGVAWCFLKEDVANNVNENQDDVLFIYSHRLDAYFNYGYEEVANTEIWPRPYTNPDSADELTAIKADVFALCNQKIAEWITGDSGKMEAEWDQYLSDLEAMGLPRMLELLQSDYEVFLEGQKWE